MDQLSLSSGKRGMASVGNADERTALDENETEGEKELVAGSPQQRNWRGIGIALLVILVICALITTAVVLLAPASSGPKFSGTPLSLKDYLVGNLSGETIETVWLQDGLLAYRDGHDYLWTIKIADGHQPARELLSTDSPFRETERARASLWVPSFDAQYVAFGFGSERLYRHSILSSYNISFMRGGQRKADYQVHTRKWNETNRLQKLRLFHWNPKGSDFVFVYENNIYYRWRPEDTDKDAHQITFTGSRDNDDVINGVADWLYEEEILGEDRALWWSKDGKYLAFVTFNNTDVKRITFDYYPSDRLYPEEESIPYPKVGEKLPTVALSVWKKDTKEVVKIMPPHEVQALGEYYIFSISWPDIKPLKGDDTSPVLLSVWSNRAQNVSYISLCSIVTGNCKLSYPQNKDLQQFGGVWVEPDDFKLNYAAGDRYFAILPRQESDNSFYKHVAAISVAGDGTGTVEFLTDGSFEVTQIVGYNREKSILFFTAASPLPRHNHLYSVSTGSPSNRSSVQCLTCWMGDALGCNVVKTDFSENANYYVLTCRGPDVPTMSLRSAFENDTIYAIDDNERLRKYIAEKALPVVKYETIPLEDGYEAVARLLYPPGYETDTEASYPLIQRVYGGPNSQYVQELWFSAIGFETYLASGRRYVVALIDGRGTGLRGTKYRKPVYRNLGVNEVKDQITAATYLSNKSQYFDKNRIAVWGWSYGGFMTAAIVEQGGDKIYQCAASVAPVTNFRYYDAAYTERYMGLYSDPGGEEAYKRTNLTVDVSNFKHIKYLLVHGTADDNVHFQNSAMLSAALTERNIPFKYMVYTNEAHSLSGDRTHLYTMLDEYFQECLKEKKKD